MQVKIKCLVTGRIKLKKKDKKKIKGGKPNMGKPDNKKIKGKKGKKGKGVNYANAKTKKR